MITTLPITKYTAEIVLKPFFTNVRLCIAYTNKDYIGMIIILFMIYRLIKTFKLYKNT